MTMPSWPHSTYRQGSAFQRNDWIEVGLDTLHFMRRHLFNQRTGLYYGSLSAMDTQHHEGGTYLWRKDQLQQVLPADLYTQLEHAWQLNQPGPWEGKWLPQPFDDPRWPLIKTKLRAASMQPDRDEKQMLGWNALVVESLIAAY